MQKYKFGGSWEFFILYLSLLKFSGHIRIVFAFFDGVRYSNV